MWTLFIAELIACCLVESKYRAIFIWTPDESVTLDAISIFIEKFGNLCPTHNYIWAYDSDYNNDIEKLWSWAKVGRVYGTKSLRELGVVREKEIKSCGDILVIKPGAKKIIMPNGTDGVICSDCNNFWPYVEDNDSPYICPLCKIVF